MRRQLIAAAVLLLHAAASPALESPYRFEGVDRLVVFADVHGAYDQLVALLRETAVVDESLHWRGGKTHLVGLGDVVDRGADSRKALDLLMRLEKEAETAGGAVHVLLGNHEVMNIVGDLRYVSPAEYAAFSGEQDATLRDATWRAIIEKDPAASRAEFDTAFPAGYFGHVQAFSPDGQYGRWLMEKPYLIVINDTAFVHAGLSPMVASQRTRGNEPSPACATTKLPRHLALDGAGTRPGAADWIPGAARDPRGDAGTSAVRDDREITGWHIVHA